MMQMALEVVKVLIDNFAMQISTGFKNSFTTASAVNL